MVLPEYIIDLLGDDVSNLVISYKKDIEAFEVHRKQMKKVLRELKEQECCEECDNSLRGYENFFEVFNPSTYKYYWIIPIAHDCKYCHPELNKMCQICGTPLYSLFHNECCDDF